MNPLQERSLPAVQALFLAGTLVLAVLCMLTKVWFV